MYFTVHLELHHATRVSLRARRGDVMRPPLFRAKGGTMHSGFLVTDEFTSELRTSLFVGLRTT